MHNPFEALDQRLTTIEAYLEQLILIQKAQNEIPLAATVDEELSISDLAEYLKVSKNTVHRYKSNKIFPFYKAGRTVFFKKSEVDAALSSEQPLKKKGAKAHG